MEKFIEKKKKQLLRGRIIAVLSLLVGIAALLLEKLDVLVAAGSDSSSVFSMCLGCAAGVIAGSFNTRKALKDPQKMKALFVSETDERNIWIEKEAAKSAFWCLLGILCAAAIVFSYINETVQDTLIAVAFIALIVLGLNHLIFPKKY